MSSFIKDAFSRQRRFLSFLVLQPFFPIRSPAVVVPLSFEAVVVLGAVVVVVQGPNCKPWRPAAKHASVISTCCTEPWYSNGYSSLQMGLLLPKGQ